MILWESWKAKNPNISWNTFKPGSLPEKSVNPPQQVGWEQDGVPVQVTQDFDPESSTSQSAQPGGRVIARKIRNAAYGLSRCMKLSMNPTLFIFQ